MNELNDTTWADAPDMLDHEVVKMRQILEQLRYKYRLKVNSYTNLLEFAKEAKERMLSDIGWIVDIDMMPCIQVDPVTKQSLPPVISFIRRVDGLQPLDHEQKRWEVLKSKERGEDLYGQKGRSA